MGNFVLTLVPLNSTKPDYTKKNGASSVLLATLLIYSTLVFAGKKKRSANNIVPTGDMQDQLLKVIMSVDEDDCVAMSLCYAASTSPERRTDGQNKLLDVVGRSHDVPVKWSDMDTQDAKYLYARYIGAQTQGTMNEMDCSKVFDNCKAAPEKMAEILSRGPSICSGLSTL